MNTEEAVKTPKKRGRKPGTKRTGYFYEEQEQAFVDYINSNDKKTKDKLFKEKLYPAFTKMIESIIRRYDLFTPSEDFSDTFNDTMSFLITKVNNYDVSKGYKVYSYCGTICKNYLILKRSQDMKKRERVLPYNNVFNENNQDKRIDDYNKENFTFHTDLINKTIDEITNVLNGENSHTLNENEIKVGYALNELLKNWENIFKRLETNKFNKTSFIYFMKETTNLTTKEIRDAMRKYKFMYFLIKEKIISE